MKFDRSVANCTRKNYEINKAIISEHGLLSPKVVRTFININELPIEKTSNPIEDMDVRLTTGVYYIKYSPKYHESRYNLKSNIRPFIMCCDILDEKNSMRVFNLVEVKTLSKTNKAIAWLLKFTNLSQTTFDVAARNIGMQIPFCIDFAKLIEVTGQDVFTPKGLIEKENRNESFEMDTQEGDK